MKDIVFGIVGGLVGAAVWAGVAYVTEYEVGWIAWGVGWLVGFCVAFANRDRGRSPAAAGVIAVVITVLSIAAGKYATVQLMMPSDEELVAMFTEGFADEEYVMSFVADEVVTEYEAADRAVEWPTGVTPGTASRAADYPPDVWGEAARRWGQMSEAEQEEFRETQEAESRANLEASLPELRAAISAGGFFGSFGPMDLLFFGLGTVTAWGVGSGRKSREELAAAYGGAVLLATLRVATADGEMTDAELECIRSALADALGSDVDAAVIRAEAEKAMGASEVLDALRDVAPHLDSGQRETAVRAAIQVALADDEVGPDEQRTILEIAKALEVSEAHLQGILSQALSDQRARSTV